MPCLDPDRALTSLLGTRDGEEELPVPTTGYRETSLFAWGNPDRFGEA